jgi:hypothetical protein
VRTCMRPGCDELALKGKRLGYWHYAATLPIENQVIAAKRRLARTPEAERRSRVPAAQWEPGTRWCSGCQTMVPTWYAQGSRCRACASSASHSAAVEKTYGITGEQYARLLALQGGRCAICRCVPRSRRLAVDHDHKTGAVRGLTCKSCNHDLLGSAHDDVEILRRAIAYLENPPFAGLLAHG